MEKTEIVKGPLEEKFYFSVYRIIDSQSEDKEQVYRSRATIIDKPQWRDNQFTIEMTDPSEEY